MERAGEQEEGGKWATIVTNNALQYYVEIIERPFKATVELFICKLDLPKKQRPPRGREKEREREGDTEAERERHTLSQRARHTHKECGMQSGAHTAETLH